MGEAQSCIQFLSGGNLLTSFQKIVLVLLLFLESSIRLFVNMQRCQFDHIHGAGLVDGAD